MDMKALVTKLAEEVGKALEGLRKDDAVMALAAQGAEKVQAILAAVASAGAVSPDQAGQLQECAAIMNELATYGMGETAMAAPPPEAPAPEEMDEEKLAAYVAEEMGKAAGEDVRKSFPRLTTMKAALATIAKTWNFEEKPAHVLMVRRVEAPEPSAKTKDITSVAKSEPTGVEKSLAEVAAAGQKLTAPKAIEWPGDMNAGRRARGRK